MIWIITSITLYLLTCGIALFLICSSVEDKSKDAYYDVRNIGVALFWPVVLLGHGAWIAGKRVFKEKIKLSDNEPTQ